MAGILGDRYQLIDLVGAGETGEVWAAYDRIAEHVVAVKLVHVHLASDPRLVDRLVRSRTLLMGLWHPGIARGIDVLVGDGQVAVVTELIKGVDLRRHFGMAITATRAAEIGVAMADALAEAHRLGIVHGALQPSNVVIPAAGDSAAKLTDFSLDLLIRAGRARSEGSRYVAPEVIDGTVPARSSDIYSLGMLLDDLVSDLDDRVPEALRQLILECTDPDQANRPSAAEAARRLRELPRPVAAAHPVRLPARVSDEPVRRPSLGAAKRPRRGLVLGSALVVIVLVAIGIVVIQLSTGTAPAARESTAPTAVVAGPSLPAAATAQTREGGLEFVRYWFALLSHAVQTGDTATLQAVTRVECGQCEAALSSIRQVRVDGGSMHGGTFTVRDVTTPLWTPDRPAFDATLDRLPRSTVDSGGATTGTTPGLTFANCVVVLEWSAGSWRVFEVTTPGCLS